METLHPQMAVYFPVDIPTWLPVLHMHSVELQEKPEAMEEVMDQKGNR